ncbi:MAG: methyltransferase [Lachnospiraceae bacterium]
MGRELWEQILQNQEVRQNLSKLRKELKNGGEKAAFLYMIAGQEEKLTALLQLEDAKIRKNAALLMGDLGKAEFLKPLYDAYVAEEQLFVKSSYLAAMRNFDYRDYLEAFHIRLEELTNMQMTPENQKHLAEEMRQLSAMVVTMEGVRAHTFVGMNETYDVILLTNRNHQAVTEKALLEQEPQAKTKIFGAGVMARVANLNWMNEVRTYQELLFVIKGMQTCPMEPEKAAELIVQSEFLEFLGKGHKGTAPYYFRIELKSKADLGKRSTFTKKLAMQIEKLSDRTLINSTSNYEVEIRLIENKEGECNILAKLYTLEDERFHYRRESVSASIKPVNAALTVALAKEYLKEDAQVLDPFCGVGTMLIERHKAVKANTTYGIDFYEEAVEKAKVNTEAAHQIIHYINRNFFDFEHEYLFDEIITNMPFCIGRKTEEEILEVYERFFPAAKRVLKEDGTIILYTHDREYVNEIAPSSGYTVQKEYEISQREGTFVMVLQ